MKYFCQCANILLTNLSLTRLFYINIKKIISSQYVNGNKMIYTASIALFIVSITLPYFRLITPKINLFLLFINGNQLEFYDYSQVECAQKSNK